MTYGEGFERCRAPLLGLGCENGEGLEEGMDCGVGC